MTAVSDRIIRLQSYAWNDWAVTQSERRQILAALRGDGNMPQTIRDLQAANQLYRLFANFTGGGGGEEPGGAAELVQLLGSGAGLSAGALVEGWRGWQTRMLYLFRVSRDLHDAYRRIGLALAASRYAAAPAELLPASADSARAPFGGAGATGCRARSSRSRSAINIICGGGIRPPWRAIPIRSPAALASIWKGWGRSGGAGRRGIWYCSRSSRWCPCPIAAAAPRAPT